MSNETFEYRPVDHRSMSAIAFTAAGIPRQNQLPTRRVAICDHEDVNRRSSKWVCQKFFCRSSKSPFHVVHSGVGRRFFLSSQSLSIVSLAILLTIKCRSGWRPDFLSLLLNGYFFSLPTEVFGPAGFDLRTPWGSLGLRSRSCGRTSKLPES